MTKDNVLGVLSCKWEKSRYLEGVGREQRMSNKEMNCNPIHRSNEIRTSSLVDYGDIYWNICRVMQRIEIF